MIFAAISSSLKEYFEKKNIPLNRASFNVIVNLKKPPQKIQDFEYFNFV